MTWNALGAMISKTNKLCLVGIHSAGYTMITGCGNEELVKQALQIVTAVPDRCNWTDNTAMIEHAIHYLIL
jgi:hypothetical protein